MSLGALLLYGGISVMAVSAVGAFLSAALLKRKTKRLQTQLEKEYGRKRP